MIRASLAVMKCVVAMKEESKQKKIGSGWLFNACNMHIAGDKTLEAWEGLGRRLNQPLNFTVLQEWY